MLALAPALAVLAAAPFDLPVGYERLSDERTRTAWAYVHAATPVRAAPSAQGRRIGRLRAFTYLGDSEAVIVLGRWQRWSRVRFPQLGADVGWVPTRTLSSTAISRSRIVIDRRSTRLRAYRDGRLRLTVRIGIGAAVSPTPAGRFYIRERVVPGNKGGTYGVLAFGLSAFSRYRTDWPGGGQVGIHGTNQPQLIPGRISNGCIRLRNADVRRLGRIAGVGTPVRIR